MGGVEQGKGKRALSVQKMGGPKRGAGGAPANLDQSSHFTERAYWYFWGLHQVPTSRGLSPAELPAQ